MRNRICSKRLSLSELAQALICKASVEFQIKIQKTLLRSVCKKGAFVHTKKETGSKNVK